MTDPSLPPTWARWLLAMVALAVVTAGALAPTTPGPSSDVFSGADKLAHALVHTVLALVLSLALVASRLSVPERVLAVLSFLVVYGGLLELVQGRLAQRHADGWDAVANAVGAASVLVWAPWLQRRYESGSPRSSRSSGST